MTFRVSAAGLLGLLADGSLAARAGPGGHLERNLSVLARDLADAGLPDIEVTVGHRPGAGPPGTEAAVDHGTGAVLAGAGSLVVVVLKPWTYAIRHRRSGTLVEVEGVGEPVLHPAVEAGRLAGAVRSPGVARGAAYLHSATDRDVAALLNHPATAQCPLFTMQRRAAFLGFLRSSLA